jgi:hypothetical protein
MRHHRTTTLFLNSLTKNDYIPFSTCYVNQNGHIGDLAEHTGTFVQ